MENNPLKFSNRNTEALKEAYSMLMDALNEYAIQKSLSEDEKTIIRKFIVEHYNKRLVEYYVAEKLSSYSITFNKLFSEAWNELKSSNFSNISYIRKKQEYSNA